MDIDDINNSQIILLVFLITLVVSAATSLATLTTMLDRIQAKDEIQEQGPTVIQQTINRIIERVPAIVEIDNEEKEKKNKESEDVAVTLEKIENSLVVLNYGSQRYNTGIFVSSDGKLLIPDELDEKRRYNIINGEDIILFSVAKNNKNYSLLEPVKEYTPKDYIDFVNLQDIIIGQRALIFGGVGDSARVFSEIVSRKQGFGNDPIQIRTSVQSSEIALPSVVFVDNKLIGFATDYSGWIYVIDNELFSIQNDASQVENEEI